MDLIDKARAIEAETNHYSGGPVRDFERVGLDAMDLLQRHGLKPRHKVLDFGCGSLRIGHHLIRFLDPGCYYGLEPIEKGVWAGVKYLLDPTTVETKRPAFRFAWDSDIGAFGVPFDFVILRSILTHTAPGMLAKILSGFAESSPSGQMLASYWRADGDVVFDTSHVDPSERIVLFGDEASDDDMRFVGYVKYTLAYIEEAAAKAGLTVEEDRTAEPINSQIWLRFSSSSRPSG